MKYQKFKGKNNTNDSHEIGVPDRNGYQWLADAQNVDVDDANMVRRRKGYTKVVTSTAIHSVGSDNAICLYRDGTALKRLASDYTSVILRNDLTPLVIPMRYLFLNGNVYYSDGISTGVYEAGVNRAWGLLMPTGFMLTPTIGMLKSGTYQVTLSYVRNNGIEGGADMGLSVIVPINGGITISNIPTSLDTTVSFINIYITQADGDIYYLAGTVANGITTFSYQGSGSEFNLVLDKQFLEAAPVHSCSCYYNGRIYVAQDNVIYYSEPYGYELFKLSEDFIMTDSPVTMLVAVNDGIWLGTQNEVIFMSGVESPFKKDIKANYGVILNTCEITDGSYFDPTFGNVAIFVTPNGICAGASGGIFKNLTVGHYGNITGRQGAVLIKEENGNRQFLVSLNQ